MDQKHVIKRERERWTKSNNQMCEREREKERESSLQRDAPLTGTDNKDLEGVDPWRKHSHIICPSGRLHALKIVPSDESVTTSEISFTQTMS